jgi:hypothetical protein
MTVTATTVPELGGLNATAQRCVDVNDDYGPTFSIYASPYWARIDQSVQIWVYSSEPLIGGAPNSVTLVDSNSQPISFSQTSSTPTLWVYKTVLLPDTTARGSVTIDVVGTDLRGNISFHSAKPFTVVDVIPDLSVHSEDITFSNINPDIGETITITALVHASSSNTSAVYNVPVTFEAHHIAGDYDIGTVYISQIDACEPTDVNWTNAAKGDYVIEVKLGPGFSDGDSGNNQATRALLVGEIPFTVVLKYVEKTRIDRRHFRYKCNVILDNLSPLAIENVTLELVGKPSNIEIVECCVNFPSIDAYGQAESEDFNDFCTIVVDRTVKIQRAAIEWRIDYNVVQTGQTIQQMSSSILALEPIALAGDITGDGKVDFEDLAILADQWLQPPGTPSADIAPPPYGDGRVNFLDFAVLAENWLEEL